MFFWDKLICLVSGRRSTRCRLRMKLTGQPPSNAAEKMVKKIAGDRLEIPLEWLERRICHELYVEELHSTWYTTDIGLCGREVFHEQAGHILGEITPGFGSILEAGHAGGSQIGDPH
jgi:hypothetical protein